MLVRNLDDDELLDGVNGSDATRIVKELRLRAGPDERIAEFLERALMDFWQSPDPKPCMEKKG